MCRKSVQFPKDNKPNLVVSCNSVRDLNQNFEPIDSRIMVSICDTGAEANVLTPSPSVRHSHVVDVSRR